MSCFDKPKDEVEKSDDNGKGQFALKSVKYSEKGVFKLEMPLCMLPLLPIDYWYTSLPWLFCLYNLRLKEVQASDKAEMQSLQKQIKDLQSGNTTLQNEREKLSEALQVSSAWKVMIELFMNMICVHVSTHKLDVSTYFTLQIPFNCIASEWVERQIM